MYWSELPVYWNITGPLVRCTRVHSAYHSQTLCYGMCWMAWGSSKLHIQTFWIQTWSPRLNQCFIRKNVISLLAGNTDHSETVPHVKHLKNFQGLIFKYATRLYVLLQLKHFSWTLFVTNWTCIICFLVSILVNLLSGYILVSPECNFCKFSFLWRDQLCKLTLEAYISLHETLQYKGLSKQSFL